MTKSDNTYSIFSLDAARRRQSPPPDIEFLHKLLDAQGEIVGAGLDLTRVASVVMRHVQALTHSTGAVIELIDGDELVYWAASGCVESQLGMRVKAAATLSGLAASSGRVLVCDDSESDPRVDHLECRGVGARSILVAPLSFGDRVIGVLKVVSPWIKTYSAADIRTLELLDSLVGAAMANAATHEEATAGLGAQGQSKALARQITRARIQRTISASAFEAVFQPIVDLRTGHIAGFEALSRFEGSPPLSPDKWFEEAESVGLSAELELATAERALLSLDKLPGKTYLALNASPATAMLPELEELCKRVDSRRVILEITEHSVVKDYDNLLAGIRRLRQLGVRLAIDDAGAGFASLRHILRLKPDFIKLDASLTRGVDASTDHQRLVSALLLFADGGDTALVAEGVETEAERAMLERLGVTYGQGFLFGKPEVV